MTRVLVTGATGFIGRTLVPVLLAQGYAVRVALRDDRSVPPEVERAVVGEIGQATDWRAALDGVDAVVHMAARVHVMRESLPDPLSAFRAVNVDGSRRLGEAAAAAGVRRLVHLSSVKAVADESGPEPLTEETTPRPSTPYGISKLEAEQALLDAAGETGPDVVNLRLPLVYGPGVKGNFLSLLGLCRRRLPLPLASVRNARSLLYAGNLADAVATALSTPDRLHGTYMIHDGAPLSTPDLIRAISSALGRAPILLPCPPRLLEVAGMLLGRRAIVSRLTENLVVDDRRLRARLGWRPPFTPSDGLRGTAEWYKRTHECRDAPSGMRLMQEP